MKTDVVTIAPGKKLSASDILHRCGCLGAWFELVRLAKTIQLPDELPGWEQFTERLHKPVFRTPHTSPKLFRKKTAALAHSDKLIPLKERKGPRLDDHWPTFANAEKPSDIPSEHWVFGCPNITLINTITRSPFTLACPEDIENLFTSKNHNSDVERQKEPRWQLRNKIHRAFLATPDLNRALSVQSSVGEPHRLAVALQLNDIIIMCLNTIVTRLLKPAYEAHELNIKSAKSALESQLKKLHKLKEEATLSENDASRIEVITSLIKSDLDRIPFLRQDSVLNSANIELKPLTRIITVLMVDPHRMRYYNRLASPPPSPTRRVETPELVDTLTQTV